MTVDEQWATGPLDSEQPSGIPAPRPATSGDPSGPLGAKLRAVREVDRAFQERRQFAVVQDRGAAPDGPRDPRNYVARRRISPRWRRVYTVLLVIGDLSLAGLAGLLGTMLPADRSPLWQLIAFAPLFVATLVLGRVYEHRFVGSGPEEFRRLAAAATVFLAAVSTLAFAAQSGSRGLVLIGTPLALCAALLWHVVLRQVLFAARRAGLCQQRVVVIGLERSVDEMITRLRREPSSGIDVVAACVERASGAEIAGVPVGGAPHEVGSVARRHFADSILLTAWSEMSEEDLRRLSWDLEGSGYQLLVAPRITEVDTPRMHLRTVAGVPLLHVDEPEFTGLRRVIKRGFDLLLASVGIVVLSPVLLAVAIAVAVSSPGPVLLRQQRIGKGDEPFRMTKFRSMFVDADQRLAEIAHLNQHGAGPMFKMRDDPRVTSVGRVIRRLSLDELPQLFDVVRGDMSLVGPRPPLPREAETYDATVRRRLKVKPGITGLWQVSGRSDLTWEESVRLDLGYVENWSLLLDLRIIFRTVSAVLVSRGAY